MRAYVSPRACARALGDEVFGDSLYARLVPFATGDVVALQLGRLHLQYA